MIIFLEVFKLLLNLINLRIFPSYFLLYDNIHTIALITAKISPPEISLCKIGTILEEYGGKPWKRQPTAEGKAEIVNSQENLQLRSPA